MPDVILRIADPDDLRFLVMLVCVLLAGAGLAVGAAARPFMHRADEGAGFRWVRRQ